MDPQQLKQEFLSTENILLVQDLDGVCIHLVKDPLTRELDNKYIRSASKLGNRFRVLTNGEHEGKRGVNTLVEKSIGSKHLARANGLYLPGLAAGGVQIQDRFGNVIHPGVSQKEIEFLQKVPKFMKQMLRDKLSVLLTGLDTSKIDYLVNSAIIDTELSPTINLNGIFDKYKENVGLQISIQEMLETLMQEILELSNKEDLAGSFYLHKAPNLGFSNNCELTKYAQVGDVGTTDIQFMLTGAIKESGLLLLISEFIERSTGKNPFGNSFNARCAPKGLSELLSLVLKNVSDKEMPVLIGVGDTVTSQKADQGEVWLRGGSDRGFLTLIQDIGSRLGIKNRVVLVDSSGGEVDRPSLKNTQLEGITDPKDHLKIDVLFKGGPNEYIDWFNDLASNI